MDGDGAHFMQLSFCQIQIIILYLHHYKVIPTSNFQIKWAIINYPRNSHQRHHNNQIINLSLNFNTSINQTKIGTIQDHLKKEQVSGKFYL